MPLVSIGCAVYNGEATVARALETIVKQDYRHIEIIVADDRSTDRTVEIVESLAKVDPRIRLIRNDANVGLVHNFNALFRQARGKYFMWADQDDLRDPTFISKTIVRLEADPDAVLCHSLTGGFLGTPDNLVSIGSIGKVADHARVFPRYAGLLREFADTTIYGLIRADALRRTGLWPDDVGSANVLLFELALLGKFLEIPETLYFYSGRGWSNRPTVAEEYSRQNAGRRKPWYYIPFLIVTRNQASSIWRSRVSLGTKAALTALLFGHTSLVVLSKLSYRAVFFLTGGHVPSAILRICQAGVGSTAHLRFVNDAQLDERTFPRDWVLRPLR